MKIGTVISTNESEAVWNAFRFSAISLKAGSDVCPISTMQDLLKLVEESDKFLIFG